MANPAEIQALVQQAIDAGATSVEEVHKRIAAMPLTSLKGLGPLAGPAGMAEDVAGRSIGAVYDAIRMVNEQVGNIANQLLGGTKS